MGPYEKTIPSIDPYKRMAFYGLNDEIIKKQYKLTDGELDKLMFTDYNYYAHVMEEVYISSITQSNYSKS